MVLVLNKMGGKLRAKESDLGSRINGILRLFVVFARRTREVQRSHDEKVERDCDLEAVQTCRLFVKSTAKHMMLFFKQC